MWTIFAQLSSVLLVIVVFMDSASLISLIIVLMFSASMDTHAEMDFVWEILSKLIHVHSLNVSQAFNVKKENVSHHTLIFAQQSDACQDIPVKTEDVFL